MNRFPALVLVLAVLLSSPIARAQVYIAYMNSGVVSEFDETTGVSINDTFILGLKEPRGLSVAHGALYVLQASGSIGTYNLQTGAAIREQLVTGLNYPQVMTVADDAIYVVDMDWQTHLPKIEKYNAYNGALINPAFLASKVVEHDGMSYGASIPTSLAVSGHRLFVTNVDYQHGLMVYDTATGHVITDHFLPYPINPNSLATSGKWLYFCIGPAVFQIDAETGASKFGVPGHPPAPMGFKFNNPKRLAIAGDDLLVGEGVATAVGKYNATTGELIKADFIPSQHDQLGALAVVPREPTQAEVDTNSQFEWHRSLFELWFAIMKGEDTYLFAGCCVLALIALIVAAFALRSNKPAPVVMAEESGLDKSPVAPEITPTPLDEAAPAVVATSAEPRRMSVLALVAVGIVVVTLGAAAYMGYSLLAPVGTDVSPYGDREQDLISGWTFENDNREASERSISLSLYIYPNEINYSEGAGPNTKPGHWHDNAFWVTHDDGSPETEAARLIDPLHMEVNVEVFYPSRTDKPVLYKCMGSAEEKAAVAAKYPGPITYPPPRGVITYYMSEYDLEALPWKVEELEVNGSEESYSRGVIHHYRSDNKQIPPLDVTVKNHQVVMIKGGYE